MRLLALAAALPLALAAPAAGADDTARDRRERAVDRRELHQDRHERRDDRRDLARVEALQGRLEALGPRPAPAALAALDADVARALAAERQEGRLELARDGREVRRDRAELRSERREEREGWRAGDPGAAADARHDRRDDRRDLADDLRDRQVEGAQLRRVEALRRDWAEVQGRAGPADLARRRALLGELAALARWELQGDRQERREDRRELREDRRETREDRR